MSTIVLVNPDIERLQERFATITLKKLTPQPPLGLCYIAATLEAAGHDVTILDGYAETLGPEALVEKIINRKPDVIGFTVTCLNVAQAEETTHLLKQAIPAAKVVFGGPQITLQPENALSCQSTDFAIQGEGEHSFVQLIDALEKNLIPASIPGLIFRKLGGTDLHTNNPMPIQNLDELPFPSRHLLDWNNYDIDRCSLVPTKRVFTLSSSRGCPHRCTYCSSSVHWNCTYRARSAVSVVDEIEMLIKDYAADGINFREDNFMVNKQRVKEICYEILKRKITVPWGCEARVDNVDRATLELMCEAGLVGIWCGVESGSPQILKQIKKDYSVEQVQSAFDLFHTLNINTTAGFMIGFPDETEDDIQKSFNLAIQIKPNHAYFQAYVAFPRGELYDYVVENKLFCDKWRDIYRVAPRYMDVNKYTEIESDLREKFYTEKNIKKQLRDLGNQILVFCTARLKTVENALNDIRLANPDAHINAVTNINLSPCIAAREEISNVYVYDVDMFTPNSISQEWLETNLYDEYDTVLVIFSNIDGQGYEGVIRIARRLRTSSVLTYNQNGSITSLKTQ